VARYFHIVPAEYIGPQELEFAFEIAFEDIQVPSFGSSLITWTPSVPPGLENLRKT
jgi:hypothetical protein